MNAAAPSPPAVRHNPAASRFEIEIDGHLSVIDYVRGDGVITFTHTFTPPEQRGRGLAEMLVRAALNHARAEQLRVVPACPYVARFIRRHAEYQGLVS
jgi:predicted GNAT family acetyltransferase